MAILQLRHGITGPATLKYSNEERLLAEVDNPQKYTDEIIWPDKVRLNLDYYYNWSGKRHSNYFQNSFQA